MEVILQGESLTSKPEPRKLQVQRSNVCASCTSCESSIFMKLSLLCLKWPDCNSNDAVIMCLFSPHTASELRSKSGATIIIMEINAQQTAFQPMMAQDTLRVTHRLAEKSASQVRKYTFIFEYAS